jgi:hypothetical protein
MWGLSLGVALMGLGIFFYRVLLVRRKIAPRKLGWLGVISGILIAIRVMIPRIDSDLCPLFGI